MKFKRNKAKSGTVSKVTRDNKSKMNNKTVLLVAIFFAATEEDINFEV